MPMYDSSLPWKEKRKIIQADIDRRKKKAAGESRRGRLKHYTDLVKNKKK